MAASDSSNSRGLTPRQDKWFATARTSLERETGKTLEEWVAIARTCPETKTMTRIAWMKAHHGLGMNRANIVMSAAFPTGTGWDNPTALRASLWTSPNALAILEAVTHAVADLPDVVIGQRKAFTGFSRNFQFAAVKPLKGGGAVLGLAVDPSADPRALPPKVEGWSERLKSKLVLGSVSDVDDAVKILLKQAWERS